jgi:hypothetical protein
VRKRVATCYVDDWDVQSDGILGLGTSEVKSAVSILDGRCQGTLPSGYGWRTDFFHTAIA